MAPLNITTSSDEQYTTYEFVTRGIKYSILTSDKTYSDIYDNGHNYSIWTNRLSLGKNPGTVRMMTLDEMRDTNKTLATFANWLTEEQASAKKEQHQKVNSPFDIEPEEMPEAEAELGDIEIEEIPANASDTEASQPVSQTTANQKIEMQKITIIWSEGWAATQQPQDFDSWEACNKALVKIHKAHEGHQAKTDFSIIYQDGSDCDGTMLLSNSCQSLGQHMNEYAEYYKGAKPNFAKPEAWEAKRREAIEFSNKYEIVI